MTGWLRRRRSSILVGAVVVASVAAVVLLGRGSAADSAVDPEDPGPGGAQAVARVLADQGVDVSVVRDADALAAADAGPGTTVVVTSPERLGRSTARRLRDDTAGARLVVVGAAPGASGLLGLPEPRPVPVGGGRDAQCDDARWSDLVVEVDAAQAYPTDGCFPGSGGALLVERDGVTALGAAQALTNDQVLRADNAALALRLLGQDGRLVWYVPSLADLRGRDGVTLASLLPPWLGPALLLLALTAAAVMVWRARRLGPLAREPLPVSVSASETTRSLGRLYRRAGSRGHAAQVLRSAALDRLRLALRLGPRTPADAVVREAARVSGRPEREVAELVGAVAPLPATDHDLITLAEDLAELDREVRHP